MVSDDFSMLASHGLERRSGAAVIIDVVASVRRIEKDELGTVVGWVDTLKRVSQEVLPEFGGRLVKSLGDGALIEFAAPAEAVRAALAIQKLSDLPLRIGIETGEFLSDVHDIYGRAVNRAARLMTLSEAGCITISDNVRAAIAADLDASIEDLGLHHLKHIAEPVRAYRVGAPAQADVMFVDPDGPVLPTLAVMPFRPEKAEDDIPGAGDILCDELIRLMSASPHLRVISRLSTKAFREHPAGIPEMARRLNARFVLTGSYACSGDGFRLELDLTDGRSGATLWRKETETRVGHIYAGSLGLLEGIPAAISRAIISRETRRAKSQKIPTLENYSLLLAAVSLTNGVSPRDLSLAGRLLDMLLERSEANAAVHAWRANWLNLRIQQGWTNDPAADGKAARAHCQRALDIDPESSLALAVGGLIATTIERNLAEGAALLDEAIRVNPNDPLAWLFRGTNRMFNDDASAAVLSMQRARYLSPLDPAAFLFDALSASAAFVAGDYPEAERLCRLSLKANRLHASTHRVLAATLVKLGRLDEAKDQARDMLDVEPGLTVSAWLKRSPSADNRVGQSFADCLRAVGIPEN